MGVLSIRGLLFGLYSRAPNLGKLPYRATQGYMRLYFGSMVGAASSSEPLVWALSLFIGSWKQLWPLP